MLRAGPSGVQLNLAGYNTWMPEVSRAFLATYRPLCRTKQGRAAAAKYAIPPYVDGSCRREPDFEADLPTITALCHGRMFAPRLSKGDRVAYVTKQGRYAAQRPTHWRLTALLIVEHRFESHTQAADWFIGQGLRLPQNCMVPGTMPVPLDHTDGELNAQLRAQVGRLTPEQIIRAWDSGYSLRARNWGVVLACRVLFRDLHNPPPIVREDWLSWDGHVPFTQTPPRIAEHLWQELLDRTTKAG
jgi:hypothetical protein